MMNLPAMLFRGSLAGLPLVLFPILPACAQSPQKAAELADANYTINSLVGIAKELNDAISRLHSDLDRSIARNDRGQPGGDGQHLRAADSSLNGGPDIVQEAVRKFTEFRMLAVKEDMPQHPVIVDMDRIQSLITEAYRRAENSGEILRRLLVVPVGDIDRKTDAEIKDRHDRLLKARGAAEAAAKRAWIELPIDLPEPDADGESADKTWDLLVRDFPEGRKGTESENGGIKPQKFVQPAIPLRLPRRQRITLLRRDSYRLALTDSGVVDANRRHVFYEEEWMQRGPAVIRMRWRVGVDTLSGQHILLKRYPLLQMQGSLDDLYKQKDRDSLWYLEPPNDVPEPSPAQIETAVADLEHARTTILAAGEDFRITVRMLLANNDRRRAVLKEPVTDAAGAASTRETLFAIRAHLAGVQSIRLAESNVRQAIENSRQKMAALASLAAWANILPDGAANPTAVEMETLFARSDREIDSVRDTAEQAVAFLPPAATQAEATFPAMQKDVIVRIRTLSPKNLRRGMVLCRQEIWHMERPMPGLREVRRAAVLIGIDPATGDQIPLSGMTKFYPAQGGDVLEEIFDEYAADDLLTLRK